MKEIWKNIFDFIGYQVSNFGRIRSLKTYKILKQYNHRNGYMFVSLSHHGKHFNLYIHRLVAEAFIPNPDNLPEVNHKDENPSNNNVNNLEWCNRKYNANYGTAIQRMLKSRRINQGKTILNFKFNVFTDS